ncbi:MAG TPA: HK97 family phage prohead protease [Edaphobacter sp.]|nr:HK97 family phage prohead protease [Edaphobacter sp.]
MQTRDFSLKVKVLDDSGTFTGLASTYGAPADLVGDIIAPGAYKQAIQMQGKGLPLLWCHSQLEPLGSVFLSDSTEGLVCKGTLLMEDAGAKRAHAFMKAGIVRGLSIGYTLPHGEGKISYNDDGTRTLKEVRLHEISLCAVPCNPGAVVTTVKTLGQIENVLRTFRPGEVTAADLDQLRAIDLSLKALLKKDALCECDCPECTDGDCANCSNPDCVDANCEGSVKAMKDAEDLKALQQFSKELRSLVVG